MHLNDDNLCRIFDDPRRPAACAAFKADEAICGGSYREAYDNLMVMELATAPLVKN